MKRQNGVCALIRCRDEGDFVYHSLCSIKDCVDEIVFVDNCSVDNSKSEAERFRGDKFRNKRMIITEWGDSGKDHHLADLNNYALSKTRTEWVLKWDVDCIAYTAALQTLVKSRNSYDTIRFTFWNLWGDPHHILVNKHAGKEHGITGSGYDLAGLERRLYRFSPSLNFKMTQYHEHYWEKLDLPTNYREHKVFEPLGCHLMTVKPSEVVTRRYFLTRFGPDEKKRRLSFKKYVLEECERHGLTPKQFGERLLVASLNEQGARFEKGHPDAMRPVEQYGYAFVFDKGVAISRKEPSRNQDYLGE